MKTGSAVASRILASLGWRLVGFANRVRADDGQPTLAGDREVEWAWCLGQLPEIPGSVLDFGAGNGVLSATASVRGHRVVAVDLEPCAFRFELPLIEYRQGDLNELELEPGSFDYVLSCSTIEHVGLAGRYAGSRRDSDGDLHAMQRLSGLLKPEGGMALTLPVGRDDVFAPLHRVYGAIRLPRLLEHFEVRAEQYWAKQGGPRWVQVSREAALAEQGSESYYALGLFALKPA